MYHRLCVLVLVTILFSGCRQGEETYKSNLDIVAEHYVKLVLAIGQYDEDFVDAYYGPDEWLPAKKPKEHFPYEELKWKADELVNKLKEIDDAQFEKMEMLRHAFLTKQLMAISTKLDMISGQQLPFDVESLALYDAVAPTNPDSYYEGLLANLDELLEGDGSLEERYLDYSSQFIIPAEKVDTVFKAAVMEARRRTKAHIKLPQGENFKIEYVTNKPWSGYNWYQGNAQSLIQVNTDLPVYIDRAIDLACHEGYPGHHVYNVQLEQNLVVDRGWVEFQVYPLFSPQSFIAEGTANYGAEMVFSKKDRLTFEREVLFPLAGLNSNEVEKYYEIQGIRKKLKYAELEIARQYLSEGLAPEGAIAQLQKYLQYSRQRAEQRLRFYDTYRSYTINYSLGEGIIASFMKDAGSGEEERWELFNELLSTPRTASGL